MEKLEKLIDIYELHASDDPEQVGLGELGALHRALKAALAEVEAALVPHIIEGADHMTYLELAHAAGYGSVTTITKIMRGAGAGQGSGRSVSRGNRAAV